MNKLVKFWTSEPKRSPAVPDGVRIYAVGDIHGNDALLARMLATIEEDIDHAQPARNVVVFLGDLIDRGPESAGVVERLRTLRNERFTPVFIAGNHEEVLIRILDGEEEVIGNWLKFGGSECLKSYGVDPSSMKGLGGSESVEFVRNAIPGHHRQFLRSFVDSFTAGDYFFVHAGIRPGVSIDEQSLTDLRWIRAPFLESRERHSKIVVHGHSISSDVEFREGRIGVDTGAYRSGKLSAIVLEGEERRVLQVGPAA